MMAVTLPCPVQEEHSPHPWGHLLAPEPLMCDGGSKDDQLDYQWLDDHHFLIAVTGWIGAGKDTVAVRLRERWGFTVTHFADPLREQLYVLNPIIGARVTVEAVREVRLREVVDQLGWQEAKFDYPEVRRLQQAYGTDVCTTFNGQNYWVDQTFGKIDGPTVIADCRFPVEVDEVRKADGVVWRVGREGVVQDTRHISETALDDVHIDSYDAVLANTTIPELWLAVDDAVRAAVALYKENP